MAQAAFIQVPCVLPRTRAVAGSQHPFCYAEAELPGAIHVVPANGAKALVPTGRVICHTALPDGGTGWGLYAKEDAILPHAIEIDGVEADFRGLVGGCPTWYGHVGGVERRVHYAPEAGSWIAREDETTGPLEYYLDINGKYHGDSWWTLENSTVNADWYLRPGTYRFRKDGTYLGDADASDYIEIVVPGPVATLREAGSSLAAPFGSYFDKKGKRHLAFLAPTFRVIFEGTVHTLVNSAFNLWRDGTAELRYDGSNIGGQVCLRIGALAWRGELPALGASGTSVFEPTHATLDNYPETKSITVAVSGLHEPASFVLPDTVAMLAEARTWH